MNEITHTLRTCNRCGENRRTVVTVFDASKTIIACIVENCPLCARYERIPSVYKHWSDMQTDAKEKEENAKYSVINNLNGNLVL